MLKHRLIRSALTGAATVAAGFPGASAQAGMFHGPPVCQGLCQLKGHMYVDPALNAYIQMAGERPVPPSSAPDFQWDDVGIGAAGAAVLLGGAAAGVALTRRRRIQRTIVS